MQKIFFKKRYFERGLSKSFKKVNYIFFFRTQFLLMDTVIKNKSRLELVTIALQVTKQVQKHSFISYILSDKVS